MIGDHIPMMRRTTPDLGFAYAHLQMPMPDTRGFHGGLLSVTTGPKLAEDGVDGVGFLSRISKGRLRSPRALSHNKSSKGDPHLHDVVTWRYAANINLAWIGFANSIQAPFLHWLSRPKHGGVALTVNVGW